MSTKSIWREDSPIIQRPSLDRTRDTDVCIVGAGIAGLTIGYLLAQARKRVVILEKGAAGEGETGRTSAHLSSMLDARYYEISGLHGEDVARTVAESHTRAIRTMEEIAKRERIDCQFRRVPGFLIPGQEEGGSEVIERELDAARAAGLPVSQVQRTPLLRSPTVALRIEDQAQFHPGAYLDGMVAAFESAGGELHCGTYVAAVETNHELSVRTDSGHRVTARHIVLASSTPFNDMFAIHTKQTACRSYVAAFPFAGRPEHALVWDTDHPYHYVRLHECNGRTYLLAGGEDHTTGQGHDLPIHRLRHWAEAMFAITGEAEYSWSGQLLEPVDKLAFIGRNPSDHPQIYVVSGTSGNGLTYGTIAGLLISDVILRRENPWEKIYDPSRITMGAAAKFLSANVNVAAQYRDWLTPGSDGDPHKMPLGSGAVVREGASKIALYRRPDGDVVRLSAVCPHLGCIVSWNPNEATWDCPCHGSRFTPDGEVLNGPASDALKKSGG